MPYLVANLDFSRDRALGPELQCLLRVKEDLN